METIQPLELTGEIDRYLLYQRMIYRIRKNTITKMLPSVGYTETEHYYSELELNTAIDKIRANHQSDISDMSQLTFNYKSGSHHYSATGGYYVAQFQNMIIVFDVSNDSILYTTDMGYENTIDATVQSSADGKILSILVYKKIRFIDTQNWKVIGQKNVSDTFYQIRFSPTGYKMLLISHQGYAWVWDLENKIDVIHKFPNHKKIGQHGFFVHENRIGVWDRLNEVVRFYDITKGIVELPQQIPYPYIPYLSFLFDEYLVCITGDKWDTLIKIDLKELIVIEEITLGKAIHLPGNPIQVNNETIVFSEFIHENNRTVKTNILSYNIKQNTLSSLKTVKGTLLMIGFVEANAIVAVHEKQLVKYEI